MISGHLHPCGHYDDCAVPDDPLCVADALNTAGPGKSTARGNEWKRRWPPSHPHPTDSAEGVCKS